MNINESQQNDFHIVSFLIAFLGAAAQDDTKMMVTSRSSTGGAYLANCPTDGVEISRACMARLSRRTGRGFVDVESSDLTHMCFPDSKFEVTGKADLNELALAPYSSSSP